MVLPKKTRKIIYIYNILKKGKDENPSHKKYKTNKSLRTHVMKECNNQDTINALIN
jgi:hypothetical protein